MAASACVSGKESNITSLLEKHQSEEKERTTLEFRVTETAFKVIEQGQQTTLHSEKDSPSIEILKDSKSAFAAAMRDRSPLTVGGTAKEMKGAQSNHEYSSSEDSSPVDPFFEMDDI